MSVVNLTSVKDFELNLEFLFYFVETSGKHKTFNNEFNFLLYHVCKLYVKIKYSKIYKPQHNNILKYLKIKVSLRCKFPNIKFHAKQ